MSKYIVKSFSSKVRKTSPQHFEENLLVCNNVLLLLFFFRDVSCAKVVRILLRFFFFQNKLKFLQKATLISNETLFSDQPPLSGHKPLLPGWTPYRAVFFFMEIKIV